mmetsp:Transcript_13804/g.27584  ORF Transcript_13804/g.27584 Transcript_13804/m.27584 type:complete len:389 (-) Transcript_13804:966-2132(-)
MSDGETPTLFQPLVDLEFGAPSYPAGATEYIPEIRPIVATPDVIPEIHPIANILEIAPIANTVNGVEEQETRSVVLPRILQLSPRLERPLYAEMTNEDSELPRKRGRPRKAPGSTDKPRMRAKWAADARRRKQKLAEEMENVKNERDAALATIETRDRHIFQLEQQIAQLTTGNISQNGSNNIFSTGSANSTLHAVNAESSTRTTKSKKHEARTLQIDNMDYTPLENIETWVWRIVSAGKQNKDSDFNTMAMLSRQTPPASFDENGKLDNTNEDGVASFFRNFWTETKIADQIPALCFSTAVLYRGNDMGQQDHSFMYQIATYSPETNSVVLVVPVRKAVKVTILTNSAKLLSIAAKTSDRFKEVVSKCGRQPLPRKTVMVVQERFLL